MEALNNIYYHLIILGQPYIVLLIGIVLIITRINRHVGVFLCIAFVLILLSMVNREAYLWGFVRIESICIGLILIITGIMAINKQNNKNQENQKVMGKKLDDQKDKVITLSSKKERQKKGYLIPVAITVFGVFSMSFVPVNEAVLEPYFKDYYNTVYLNLHRDYPLTMAVYKQDMRELEALLQGGADPNEVMDGMSLMKRIILLKYDDMSKTSSNTTPSSGFEVVRLLLDAGYDVNEVNENGGTLLMYATTDQRKENHGDYDKSNRPVTLTGLLISYGADVNACDNEGRTALMWACNYRGYLSDRNMVTEDLPFIPYSDDYYQRSFPVFYYEQIKCLIDNGADVNAQDKNGNRAVDYFKFAIDENSKKETVRAIEMYQSQEFLDLCKAIEELLQSEPISQEEALTRASECFQEGARFTFSGKKRIRVDQNVGTINNPIYKVKLCYIFDVFFEEQYVSSVAVEIIDGVAWFLVIDEDEMDDSKPWINENPFVIVEELGEEALDKEIENERID